MYFDGERAWKLLGLSGVTRHGAARPEGHRPAMLRYAAPELLLAELQEASSKACLPIANIRLSV